MGKIVHAFTGGCLSSLEPLCKKGKCITPSCEDAQPHCGSLFSYAGIFARAYCPVTCGCHDMFSAQLLFMPNIGCPASCSVKRARQTAARSCVDAEVGSAEITAYGQALMGDTVRVRSSALHSVGQGIVDYSCQIVTDYSRESLCISEPDKVFFSLRLQFFCPVTCGCKTGELGCPTSCPASQPAAASSALPPPADCDGECKAAVPCYSMACQDGKMSLEGPFSACARAKGVCDACYPQSACGALTAARNSTP